MFLFGKNGRTVLTLAAEKGQVTVVKLLLSHQDVGVNVQNKVSAFPSCFLSSIYLFLYDFFI